MTSIADYNRRQVDLTAYQGVKPGGERQLTMELVGSDHGGRITAGIQSLVQRFLILLLTEKGSVPHFPNRGCEFLTEARTGVWQVPFDVFTSFSASLVDIEQQLKAEELYTDPPDERYSAAEVLTVSLSGGNASISIQLTSRAGSSYTFIAPISVGV